MSITAMKMAVEFLEAEFARSQAALIDALRTAISEAEACEPVAWRALDGALFSNKAHEQFDIGTEPLYLAPPQAQPAKPLFRDFIAWAAEHGYDSANTCNSDTGEWICLNPMTADLWKAWQAAHGVVEQPSQEQLGALPSVITADWLEERAHRQGRHLMRP